MTRETTIKRDTDNTLSPPSELTFSIPDLKSGFELKTYQDRGMEILSA